MPEKSLDELRLNKSQTLNPLRLEFFGTFCSPKSKNKINALNSRLEYYKAQPDLADTIQTDLNAEIQKWSEKTRRLGAIPLALFKVKIPAATGHFVWEFPSVELTLS